MISRYQMRLNYCAIIDEQKYRSYVCLTFYKMVISDDDLFSITYQGG